MVDHFFIKAILGIFVLGLFWARKSNKVLGQLPKGPFQCKYPKLKNMTFANETFHWNISRIVSGTEKN